MSYESIFQNKNYQLAEAMYARLNPNEKIDISWCVERAICNVADMFDGKFSHRRNAVIFKNANPAVVELAFKALRGMAVSVDGDKIVLSSLIKSILN